MFNFFLVFLGGMGSRFPDHDEQPYGGFLELRGDGTKYGRSHSPILVIADQGQLNGTFESNS